MPFRKVAVVAALAVALVGLAPVAPVRAAGVVTGSVDWHNTRQGIDGWGASTAFAQGQRLKDFPEPERSRVLDLLYSKDKGIGLSMVRNELPKISNAPGVYDYNRDPGTVWVTKEAQARGADYVLATAWSPPGWMKDNNSDVGGGKLRREMYALYADYLISYVKGYRDTHGLVVNGVSIANEPDAATFYPSSIWSAEDFRIFIRDYLGPLKALRGVDFDVVMPESSGWTEEVALPTLNDPAAEPFVDIVAAHGYHYVTTPSPLHTSRDKGKRVWQTEFSEFGPMDASIGNGLKWARYIHEFMTRAEANSFSYWWAMSEVQNEEALINLDINAKTTTVNKRMWTMGNFSRFVRPGWVRVETPVDGFNPEQLVSAYRDPASGKFAVVAVNDSALPQDVSLALNGFAASSVTPYRTSASEDLAVLPAVSTMGRKLQATLAPQSVTTFVGTGTASTPWRVASADRVVVSAGQSVVVPVTVSSAGGVGTVPVRASAALPLVASPGSASVGPFVPGGSVVHNVTVAVPAGTAPGEYPLDVRVGSSSVADVVARTLVRVVGDVVEFSPGGAAEAEWLAEPSSSQLGGPVYDGRARYADAVRFPTRYFVYRFDLPADVVGATVSVDMGNQFKVSASTEGRTFTPVLTETRPIRDLSNRQWYSFDADALAAGGRTVFLKFEDSQPADGWGVWVARIRANFER